MSNMAVLYTVSCICVLLGCFSATVKGQCRIHQGKWECDRHCVNDEPNPCNCDTANGWSGNTTLLCQRQNIVRSNAGYESSSESYDVGSKAVDGSLDTASVSRRVDNTYWSVLLKDGPRSVRWITVVLNAFYYDEFRIDVLRSEDRASQETLCVKDVFKISRSKYTWDIDCGKELTGERVAVTLLRNASVLTIYEVKVYSCASGTYGEQCDLYCPPGCPTQCSPVSGECLSCAVGKYGRWCETDCSTGCYNSVCNIETGVCTKGCMIGHAGSTCIACNPGTYGVQCGQLCSQGCTSGECDGITGTCSPCKTGYSGDMCAPCITGYFGQNCEKTCLYCHSYNCTNKGECNKCPNGRFGNNCQKNCSVTCGADKVCHIETSFCDSCKDGYYGDNCSMKCNDYCENPGTCSRDGTCNNGCKKGWVGPMCNKICSFTNCANCEYSLIGGKTSCVKCTEGWFLENGQCLKCPMNCTSCDSENDCTACLPGLSGSTCSEQCNIQCKNKTCDIAGICQDGCNLGFYSPKCDKRCSDNCTGGYTECSDEHGLCLKGCSNRAYGPDCSLPCRDNCNRCADKWKCQRCDEGYYREYCWKCRVNCLSCSEYNRCTTCIAGMYGQTCTTPCPTHCNTCFNGTMCFSCDNGRTGMTCECNSNCSDSCGVNGKCLNGCRDGLYGTSCDLRCTSSDCEICDQITGNCTKCITGKYGENCTDICLLYCQYGECEMEGKCIWGCVEGFYGERCQDNELSTLGTSHLLGMYLGIATTGFLLILLI